MTSDSAFIPLLVMLLIVKMAEGTIMCSRCRSDRVEACETTPPSPEPCPESGSGVTESCSTIRIFNIKTKELQQFIRSCSSTEYIKDDCFDSAPGFRTCAKICYTDGCNSARSLYASIWPWLFVCLSLIMTFTNG